MTEGSWLVYKLVDAPTPLAFAERTLIHTLRRRFECVTHLHASP